MEIWYDKEWDVYQWREDAHLIANFAEQDGKYWMIFTTDIEPMEITKDAFESIKDLYNGSIR